MAVAILGYFFEPVVYHIPEPPHKINIREQSVAVGHKILYWVEWFEVDHNSPSRKYSINWTRTIEVKKFVELLGLQPSKVLLSAASFLLSSAHHQQITLHEGKEVEKKEVMIFSHGKTTTPFFYSYLQRMFTRRFRVMAAQHHDEYRFDYGDEKSNKKAREEEVEIRAKDIEYLFRTQVKEDEALVLMGHSYGCATIIQAYHQYPELRKRVKKIVLLDPWLYPLSEHPFKTEIECPLYICANEYFLAEGPSIADYIHGFVALHKDAPYLAWKGADHSHQTDLCFVLGNTLRKVKNSHLSDVMMENNVGAVNMFLEEHSKEEIEAHYTEACMG